MRPHRASAFADAAPVDGRGRRSNHTLLLIKARDALLAEGARFFPASSDRETARQLRVALLRYRNGRWRRDCTEATCPVQHAGTYRSLLWLILKLHDYVPCDKTVRTALARASLSKPF
jgi:hypothetical protein